MHDVTPIDEEFIFEDGVIITQTDLDGNIIYANKKALALFGYERDELIGKPYSIIRHPDMPDGLFEKMWNTISSGEIFSGTVKNIRKDGSFFWVHMEILPVKNEDNKTIGYIASKKAASKKDIEDAKKLFEKMK